MELSVHFVICHDNLQVLYTLQLLDLQSQGREEPGTFDIRENHERNLLSTEDSPNKIIIQENIAAKEY